MTAEITPPAWALQDRASFPGWVTSNFRYEDASDELMLQQRFVRDYLQAASPFRGLLLYHGLGSGKTCAAIVASESARKKRVVVMVPASLRHNYVTEIRKCGDPAVREDQRWASDDRGVWSAGTAGGVPFARLDDAQREAVRRQVNATIVRSNVFFNYNGATARRVKELCDASFDDAVVVVDEAHDFVSAVSNGGLLSTVYQAIMDARRCKVVLLSGTPLVNRPVELALLVNLAHGYLSVHDFALRSPMEEHAAAQLAASPRVLDYREEFANGRATVSVRLAPEGFVVSRGTPGMRLVAEPAASEEAALAAVADILAPHGVVTRKGRQVLLLPVDPEAFDALFVDADDHTIKNRDLLTRRLLGCISYFRGHDASLYPTVGDVKVVRLPMSARQYAEYSSLRSAELAQEQKARLFARLHRGAADDDGFAGYRPFSRAVCNFAFPESVPRPYKADFGPGSATTAAATSTAKTGRAERKYHDALDAAVASLGAVPGLLAVGPGGLSELSPKIADIVGRLLALKRGTAIVYSQFRRAEGVALLAEALKVAGFAEMRIERVGGRLVLAKKMARGPAFAIYSNEDREVADALMAVFNDRASDAPPGLAMRSKSNLRGEILRVLLITKSGAQGLNTRNVRQVHIMEPFWHANRAEQVIGRAVRAHSHDALPAAERRVDVFVYLATFTPEQARNHPKDGGKTSDEFVLAVSQDKRKVMHGLLSVMRSASVDCSLWGGVGEEDACYAPPLGLPSDAMLYHVDIAEDVGAARPAKLVAVRVEGVLHYVDPITGQLYDHAAMKRGRVVALKGRRLGTAKLRMLSPPP